MPTIFTHAIAASAIGTGLRPKAQGPSLTRFWVLTAACAMLPDADVVAFDLGLEYGHMFGHRGISHSLAFAVLVGALMAWLLGRGEWRRARWVLFAHFAMATASHGFLDAFTDDGLGVAFFAPLSGERYFFPWRPLEVSPIGGHGFFTTADMQGGLRWIEVLRSEIQWVWLPALLGGSVAAWLRSKKAIQSNPSADV